MLGRKLAIFITTFTLVDDLWLIYEAIPFWIFFAMFGLSFCWGIGNMLWGFSISSIGMSLAFSLFLGVITSIDTLMPLLLLPEGQESVIGTDVGNMMFLLSFLELHWKRCINWFVVDISHGCFS